ncbi:membrane associated rhomboid family serine protease [Lewinella aquimaris]|uniref:Membrane associated rhomboid family serine protease n=1 Tax=Neolewinella aquimaris TaxID=1835722 RepID=A0A840E658_9BACT|nr:rhomboid family intramembrane serine protease [Neolewinella aquimaris]MBB4081154.1 membrane associated rhomboid family serine protease [Neolewinella aquimaris]
MISQGIAGTLILIFTGLITYLGLSRKSYQDEYKLDVDEILINKEYHRLFSSGFLHANWIHFAFNMGALISFSLSLEMVFGVRNFLLVYFLSLLGGNVFALFIHRNHGDYTAVGASGAVSGVIASSILLYPFSEIGLLFIPISFTSWIFGLALIIVSILGIKSQADNIGHEAHLGGIITGILLTVVLRHEVVFANWWVLLLLLLPISGFMYVIFYRPEVLITNKWNFETPKINLTSRREVSVDDVLDKIKSEGFSALTKKEKEILQKSSEQR